MQTAAWFIMAGSETASKPRRRRRFFYFFNQTGRGAPFRIKAWTRYRAGGYARRTPRSSGMWPPDSRLPVEIGGEQSR
jgi:hypothetical protein